MSGNIVLSQKTTVSANGTSVLVNTMTSSKLKTFFGSINIGVGVLSIGAFIAGLLFIFGDDGYGATSGPIGVSDSCCIGIGFLFTGGVLGIGTLVIDSVVEQRFGSFKSQIPTYAPPTGPVTYVAPVPEKEADDSVEEFDKDHPWDGA